MARFRVIVARNRSKCSGTLLENEDVWADLLDLLLPEGDGCVAVLTAYIDASERKDCGLSLWRATYLSPVACDGFARNGRRRSDL
jgi:hypothetical protein